MEDQISSLHQSESKLRIEIQDLERRLRKAQESLKMETEGLLRERNTIFNDYERL